MGDSPGLKAPGPFETVREGAGRQGVRNAGETAADRERYTE